MTNDQVKLINQSSHYFSKYCGVWFNKKKEWRACFQARDIKINLGPFSTEEEASKAYCEEYEKYFQKILANQK
jgi:AP2 domain.